MKRTKMVLIPSGAGTTRSFDLPDVLFRVVVVGACAFFVALGLLVSDYLRLREAREHFEGIALENRQIKGEARVLAANLDTVKSSLRVFQAYADKLSDLVNIKVSRVGEHVGIGPLSTKEAQSLGRGKIAHNRATRVALPVGVDVDSLEFRTAFDRLHAVEVATSHQTVRLKELLSTLSQKKILLDSIPSQSPLRRGWITSNFGNRISPFTGEKSFHKGLDIAAAIGTPIYAPADGVVAFAGRKDGFGNYIIIAHFGHSIVTGYGHNDQNMVQAGQIVKRGDLIASVGNKGRTTGPHLHYEVSVDGRPVNPRKFMLDAPINL